MPLTSEAKNDVRKLLQKGQKIQAVKYLADTFDISLKEALTLVELAEKENIFSSQGPAQQETQLTPSQESSETLNVQHKAEVTELLIAGKKIEALKYIRQNFQKSLKETVLIVEEIDKETNPNYYSQKASVGCFGSVFKVVGLIFFLIGIIFAAVAGVVYYYQYDTIKNSERVAGVVVDFRYLDKEGVAPVIEYERHGEKKLYYGTTYATPPNFTLNQEVFIFVNTDNPENAIVDTFSERWLLIAIFGGIGGFLILFAALFAFKSRKF